MKRTAAQRRKDKARHKIRRRHGFPSNKELAEMRAVRGQLKFVAILDDAATFLPRSSSPPPRAVPIPMHKSVEEYFDDIDKELAKLPESDRTKENEATLLANVIRDGLGLPALPLSKGKDDG